MKAAEAIQFHKKIETELEEAAAEVVESLEATKTIEVVEVVVKMVVVVVKGIGDGAS